MICVCPEWAPNIAGSEMNALTSGRGEIHAPMSPLEQCGYAAGFLAGLHMGGGPDLWLVNDGPTFRIVDAIAERSSEGIIRSDLMLCPDLRAALIDALADRLNWQPMKAYGEWAKADEDWEIE